MFDIEGKAEGNVVGFDEWQEAKGKKDGGAKVAKKGDNVTPLVTESIDLAGLTPVPNHRSLLAPDVEQEEEAVAAITKKVRTGHRPLPDIIVYVVAGAYLVIDGWYRVLAARKLGRTTINATLCEGTLQEAMLAAAGSNMDHGFRPSPAQQWAIVYQLLNDREILPEPNVKAIRRITGYSPQFIRRCRDDGSATYPAKKKPGQGKDEAHDHDTEEIEKWWKPWNDEWYTPLSLLAQITATRRRAGEGPVQGVSGLRFRGPPGGRHSLLRLYVTPLLGPFTGAVGRRNRRLHR